MRQFMAALAALLVALPAAAQTQIVPYNGVGGVTGTLTTIGDFVPINLAGGKWATAQWSVVGTAGTATITTEISLDGGTNWLPSAYSKRLDTVAANPSVSPWVSNTGVSGSVWETPLPGNATQFRLRCGNTGTTTSVQLQGGTPYVPGVPVAAVLYDVTEGSIGAGLGPIVQDTSGWNSVTVMGASPTSQIVAVRQLDDSGATISGATATFPAAAGAVATFTRYGSNTTASAIGSAAQALFANLTRRMQWAIPAGGTVSTGRIRVEAAR